MTVVVFAVGAVLAAVAAAGVLWPYVFPRRVELDPPADPADDERRRGIREVAELEVERLSGAMGEETYRGLREEAELRAVAALRAAEARIAAPGREGARWPGPSGDGSAARPSGDGSALAPAGDGQRRPGRPGAARRALVPFLVAGLLLAALVPPLTGAIRARAPGEPISGAAPPGSVSIALLEERVREHPGDLAARLDLAEAYLDERNAGAAIEQYVAALRIDPRSAEAHARLGALLFQAGRPRDALRAVDRALEIDPRYPEALYFRGVILLRGLDRPDAAREAFQAYIDAAPFGSHRQEVAAILEETGAQPAGQDPATG